eukprot:gb/GECG01005672.1/.p1 GENE.gb/GECG01005672.1/~~gb/GECG01005672.1/.p1  ORF type:complete len:293 (+),score=5.68 gb/GECG01005672.1/:1-879(+)
MTAEKQREHEEQRSGEGGRQLVEASDELIRYNLWRPPPFTLKSLLLIILAPHTFFFPLFGTLVLTVIWMALGYLPELLDVPAAPASRTQAWVKSLGFSAVVAQWFLGMQPGYFLMMLFRTSLLGGVGWYFFDMAYGKARRTGERMSNSFLSMWTACHGYFPVSLFMWDGEHYTNEPNVGHYKVYNVDKRKYIFGLHPHGPIPIGASAFMPQLSRYVHLENEGKPGIAITYLPLYRWSRILEKTRIGVASAVFNLPFMRDFYLWYGGNRCGNVHPQFITIRAFLKNIYAGLVL